MTKSGKSARRGDRRALCRCCLPGARGLVGRLVADVGIQVVVAVVVATHAGFCQHLPDIVQEVLS